MIFVSLMKMREGKMQPSMAQRIQWEYPESVRLIGEFWLTTNDPKVISIYETDDQDAMMQMETLWDEYFDMRIYPAMTAEHGIKWVKSMFSA